MFFASDNTSGVPEPVLKALAAVNLSLFLGTAVMQSATDPVAALGGLPAVLLFMATELVAGALVFLWWTRAASGREARFG